MQYASETHSAKFFRLFQLETPLAFYLLTSTPNLVSSLIWLFLRGLLVLRITWKKKRKESLEVFIKVQIPGCVPLTSFTCPCAVLAEEDPSHLHFEPTHPSSFWSCGPEAQLWEYLMLLKKKKNTSYFKSGLSCSFCSKCLFYVLIRRNLIFITRNR